jgi:hypothetical protein
LFFTPNLSKKALVDAKLEQIKFDVYTRKKSAERKKSMEKIERSLSRSRHNSRSRLDKYQTSLTRYTQGFYRGKKSAQETPKVPPGKKESKDLSQYLTPQNFETITQVKSTFKKAQIEKERQFCEN